MPVDPEAAHESAGEVQGLAALRKEFHTVRVTAANLLEQKAQAAGTQDLARDTKLLREATELANKLDTLDASVYDLPGMPPDARENLSDEITSQAKRIKTVFKIAQ